MTLIKETISFLNENNPHVVVWSGGCDSTILLKEIAEKHSTSKKPVLAISMNHHAIDPLKSKKEQEKRVKILKELRKRGLFIDHETIQVHADLQFINGVASAQSYIWLTNVIPFVPHNGTLYFGFIRPDDILLHYTEFFELGKKLCKFLDKDITISAPYYHVTKENVIMELIETDLYEKTWHCEMPTKTGQKCNSCNPCTLHNKSLLHLGLQGYTKCVKYLPDYMKDSIMDNIINLGKPKKRKRKKVETISISSPK